MQETYVPSNPIVLICQICGRARWFVGWEKCVDEEGWWVDLHRDGSWVVIRCPQHISDWCLKQSMEGRTAANRRRAVQGRLRPRPPDAGREPLPIGFRGAEALLAPLRTKYQKRAARMGGMWQERVAQWVPEKPTTAQGAGDEVSDRQGDATT